MADITSNVGKGGKGKPDPRLSANGKTESSKEINAYDAKLRSGLGKTTAKNEAFKGKDGPSPKGLTK